VSATPLSRSRQKSRMHSLPNLLYEQPLDVVREHGRKRDPEHGAVRVPHVLDLVVPVRAGDREHVARYHCRADVLRRGARPCGGEVAKHSLARVRTCERARRLVDQRVVLVPQLPRGLLGRVLEDLHARDRVPDAARQMCSMELASAAQSCSPRIKTDYVEGIPDGRLQAFSSTTSKINLVYEKCKLGTHICADDLEYPHQIHQDRLSATDVSTVTPQ
jgi:hypothetical protein